MLFSRVSRREASAIALMAACYFAVASIVILTARAGPGLAVIWPATAILLIQLIRSPRRMWAPTLIAAALASFCATSLFGLGWVAAVPLAVFNVFEAWIGAYLIRLRAKRASSFDSLSGFGYFLLAAGLCAPALSGVGGATVTWLLGQDFLGNWLRWTTGHGLGSLIFTPFVWLIHRGEGWRTRSDLSPAIVARNVIALGIVIAVALAIFLQNDLSLLFVTILPVMVTTFTLGRLGTALSLVALAVVGAVCTFMGFGPVASLDQPDAFKIVYFQSFLAVLVLTVLPVAAELQSRKLLNKRLEQSEARYRLLTEASSDIILNVNIDGTILFASPSVTDLGGYSQNEVVGRSALELIHPDFTEIAAEAHRWTLKHPHETHMIEYPARTKDGKQRWFESNMKAVVSSQGELLGTVNTIRNIDHRKAREEALYSAAGTDMLTRLLSRQAFFDALDDFQRSGHPGCLAIFDLDRFGTINDRFGRFTGDQLLRKFADAARKSVRTDDLIGRIDGEEFAILLPRASRTQAVSICERLRTSVAALPLPVGDGDQVGMTASAGVVEIQPGETQEDLRRRAEAALQEAKQAGCNRLVLAA